MLKYIHHHSGFSLLESLCAIALFSFLILATLNIQTRSLQQFNSQARDWEHYSRLSGWRPADLESTDCTHHSGPSGKTVIVCSRDKGTSQHPIQAAFLIN